MLHFVNAVTFLTLHFTMHSVLGSARIITVNAVPAALALYSQMQLKSEMFPCCILLHVACRCLYWGLRCLLMQVRLGFLFNV